MKRNLKQFIAGVITGAIFTGGIVAITIGLAEMTVEPLGEAIYIDGQRTAMSAYHISGNNYVKLQDIGQKVGFNVYIQDGIRIETDMPYTGQAPADLETLTSEETEIQVSSFKGGTLKVGEHSGLIIGSSGTDYTVTSSNPDVADVQSETGSWMITGKERGTALISVVNSLGETGSLTITVE